MPDFEGVYAGGVGDISFSMGVEMPDVGAQDLGVQANRAVLSENNLLAPARIDHQFADMRAQLASGHTPTAAEILQNWVDAEPDKTARDARAHVRNRMLEVGVHATDKGLVVQGYLWLNDCPNLRHLPDNLHVKGSLNIFGCRQLEQLPNNLCVDGSLDIFYCERLEYLTETLQVGQSLNIGNCDAIAVFPQGLHVGEKLFISNCNGFRELPVNVRTGADLYLYNCNSFTNLNAGTVVGQNLYIYNCPAFLGLPADLAVGNNVELRNCPTLNALPHGLKVGGWLSLGDLRYLNQDPSSVVAFLMSYLQAGGAADRAAVKVLGMHTHGRLMEAVTTLSQSFLAARQTLLDNVEDNDFSFEGYFSQSNRANENDIPLAEIVLSEKAVEAVERLRESNAYRTYTLQKCQKRFLSQASLWPDQARISNAARGAASAGKVLPNLPAEVEANIRMMALKPNILASLVPDPVPAMRDAQN